MVAIQRVCIFPTYTIENLFIRLKEKNMDRLDSKTWRKIKGKFLEPVLIPNALAFQEVKTIFSSLHWNDIVFLIFCKTILEI